MKKALVGLFVAMVVSMVAAQELAEIPANMQGVWRCIGYSSDKGVTSSAGGMEMYCRVSSGAVVMANGVRLVISQVLPVVIHGKSYIWLKFDGLLVSWLVSVPENRQILVQIMDETVRDETYRYSFKIF